MAAWQAPTAPAELLMHCRYGQRRRSSESRVPTVLAGTSLSRVAVITPPPVLQSRSDRP